jgi:hypothetical protein
VKPVLETSLNSKAFGVMLSTILALTVSAAVVGWSDAQAASGATAASAGARAALSVHACSPKRF